MSNNKNLILIDGDIIVYGIAFGCAEMSDWADVKNSISEYMEEVTTNIGTTKYIGFLQGSKNFRTTVATQAPYKGNRKSSSKPFWFNSVRDHLVEAYKFVIVDGMETDDALTILHKRLADLEPVIATVDKDLLQSPGRHYNFRTKELSFSTEYAGLDMLAEQIITGDSTDNIKGLYRVGPVKAQKILSAAETKGDFLPLALQAYLNYYTELKKKEKSVITDEEVFLKAVKHFAETFELVFLRRDMDEEEFPTPEITDLLTLENPLLHGAGKRAEGDIETIFD